MFLALAYRPWSYRGEPMPALDAWLAVAMIAIGVQLLPLPAFIIDTISPATRRAWQQLVLTVPSALPISIDLNRTAQALLVAAGAIVVFLSARRIFALGGVRTVARGVSIIGMLLAAIALAQDATSNGLVYWRWKLIREGPLPFGPFVNRNHFATWAILAVPLCLGYLAAHSAAHRHRTPELVPLRRRIVTFFDGRAMSLTTAACLLIVALIVTLSRSGFVGLSAAALTGALLRAGRKGTGGRAHWWIAGGLAVAVALTLAELRPAILGARLTTANVALSGRLLIWRDTIPILRDFWLTGTGAGTFLTSMLLYQRSSPGWLYNQAHNHYLQVLSEGGLLVGVPVFAALATYGRDAWASLSEDKSGMFWVRAGAFCGLTGAAVQSVWETGLTMPANAALAAIAAAIVVHNPAPTARH